MELKKIYNLGRKQNSASVILLLLMIGGMFGCKVPKVAKERPMMALPQNFGLVTDTSASVVALNWQTYFADSTLNALIDEALANNLDLLSAYQRIEMARAGVVASESFLRPATSIGGMAALRKFGHYTMDGAGNATTDITEGKIVPVHLPDFFLGLQSSWEVDIWKKLRNQQQSAVSRYLASVEGKNWVVTNLVADVAGAYYELLSLDNELEIVRETIKIQQSALEIVKIQRQAAITNELAVEQFEARLLNAQNLEIGLSQSILEAENFLNTLLGRYPQPIIRNKNRIQRNIPNEIQTGIPSDLLKNRPDLKAAELELIATKADVNAARAAFYPSLVLTGSLGFQAFSPKFLLTTPQSIAYSLVSNLTAPVINRKAIIAHFNGVQAVQVEALYNYQKAILNAYVEVNNGLNQFNNLQRMYELKVRETSVLTRSITTSDKLYRTGRATYLEVLFAQQNALQGRLELISTQKHQNQTFITLYRALGGGWK